MNMAYCRFENTFAALRDCTYADGMDRHEALSESERAARKQLISLCAEIAQEFKDELEKKE